MIERCTRRRMLLSIVLLAGLSIAIVLLEHHLTQNTHFNTVHLVNHSAIREQDKECWLHEKFEVIEQCHPCSDLEKSTKTETCTPTGFKEQVHCTKSGKVYRSCERALWLEEKRFWTLEIVSVILGLVSSTFVMWRQRILEHKHYQRLQQQIAMTPI